MFVFTMNEPKEERACPICGRTLKEQLSWTNCPREGNKHICEFHCFQCKDLNKSISLVFCEYKEKLRRKKGY